MINKIIKTKVILVIFLVMFFCCNFVSASSINSNTIGSTLSNNITSSQTTTNNVTASSSSTNDTGSTYSSNRNTQNSITDTSIGSTNSTVVQSVGNVNSSSGDGIQINEILNVLLIAVGFVLILLAIAILIRLK